MKRKRLIIAVLALLMVGPLCLSQDQDIYLEDHWDVNGIYVDQKYTYDQIVAHLGKPKSVDEEKDVDWLLLKYDDGSVFAVFEDCCDAFTICTNKYSIFTQQLEGGIKVGDPISKIYKIKKASPVLVDVSKEKMQLGLYYYNIFPNLDSRLMIFTNSKAKDAKITGIRLFTLN